MYVKVYFYTLFSRKVVSCRLQFFIKSTQRHKEQSEHEILI